MPSENVWSRFDDMVDAEEVVEARSNFESPTEGNHDVVLEKLVPSESSSGLPMLKGRFRDLENNSVIFYNQMLQNLNYPDMTKVNVAQAVTLVSTLLGEEIKFVNLSKFAQLILDMNEFDDFGEPVSLKPEYMIKAVIKVSYGKKDVEHKFPQIKVLGLLEDSGKGLNDKVDNSDGLPFE